MRRVALLLLVTLIACKEKLHPAETQTMGNATDRSPVTGTSATGEPRNIATESAASATQLGTVTPTGTQAIAVTGTTVVNAAKTETTSTLVAPTTTTASIATPTDTSATIQTMTGAKTTQKKKH